MTNIHEAIDQALKDAEAAGHAAGVIEGRKQIGREANDLVQRERETLLEQGREQARREMEGLIEEAREEGRVMGVEEGRGVGKMHADKKAFDKGKAEGVKNGHAAGYKEGRGEGYRNGWNDCINTPPSQQKPR